MALPVRRTSPLAGALVTLTATCVLVAVMAPFRDYIGLLNAGLLLLLLAVLIAAYWGREVGLFAAVVTNLAFNFFFIDPLHTFTVQEPKNIVALLVFLAVAVVAGSLLAAAQRSARDARRRQAEAEAALEFGRAMSSETEPSRALATLCREIVRLLDATGAAVLTRAEAGWRVVASSDTDDAARALSGAERLLADEAIASRAVAGMGGGTPEKSRPKRIVIPRGRRSAYAGNRSVAFVPVQLGEEVSGVLRLDGPIGDSPFRDDVGPVLTAIAGEAAVTMQRIDLAREAAHVQALKEADEMKTALMASISHDLKTPLAGIKAAVSSLLDRNIHWSEDDVAAFLSTIDAQADRLNRLISDILDLNRIESGDLEADRTAVGVRDLLVRARDVTSFEARGREVTVEAPGDLAVTGDEALLLQAVVNLVENAIKYSTSGGAIHLRAFQEGARGVIEVADEGPGIAPDDLPHVFDRFYRASEHNRRVKGSGMGLTIVKGFVELCEGTVDVESSPRGTVFKIRLPIAAPATIPA